MQQESTRSKRYNSLDLCVLNGFLGATYFINCLEQLRRQIIPAARLWRTRPWASQRQRAQSFRARPRQLRLVDGKRNAQWSARTRWLKVWIKKMLLRQRHMSDGVEFQWQRAIFTPHDARTSKRSAWRNFKRVQASLQRGGLLRILHHGLRDFKYGAAFMQKRQIARDELVKRCLLYTSDAADD
jgi:hypothetical protein